MTDIKSKILSAILLSIVSAFAGGAFMYSYKIYRAVEDYDKLRENVEKSYDKIDDIGRQVIGINSNLIELNVNMNYIKFGVDTMSRTIRKLQHDNVKILRTLKYNNIILKNVDNNTVYETNTTDEKFVSR